MAFETGCGQMLSFNVSNAGSLAIEQRPCNNPVNLHSLEVNSGE
jgi:hypothetical protein